MRWKSWAFVLLTAALLTGTRAADAQNPHAGEAGNAVRIAQTTRSLSEADTPRPAQLAEQLNANTVTIISGRPNGTYLYFAYDMSAVLDDGKSLRVLPIVGKGAAQNTKDLLFLEGVDMGMTQSDILRYFDKTGELGANISSRLRYITKLYNEEMHVLARPGIRKIADLLGKKVHLGNPGSGTQISSRLIFDALGIKVKEVTFDQADAIDALRRGEIAAMVVFGGKPVAELAQIDRPAADFRLIGVPYPKALRNDYLRAELTHSDYPNLIPEGQVVETVAVGSVLAVFNWARDSDRYRRVANFTKAFFENFERLQEKPQHPKWREVDLAAELPGWERFGAAKEMLRQRRQNLARQGEFSDRTAPTNSLLDLSEEERDRLFRDFMEWKEKRSAR